MTGTTSAISPTPRPTIRRRSTSDRVVIANPADYVHIVGQTFVKYERQPVLTLGTRHWDRWALGRLGVPHTAAAGNLNRVLAQLGITTISALATRLQEVGTYIGIGVTAYWVCLAVLKEAGYEPADMHGTDVTYGTVKARALKERAKTTSRRRKRRTVH